MKKNTLLVVLGLMVLLAIVILVYAEPPVPSSLVVNASKGNGSDVNLTFYFSMNTGARNITDWRLNETSIALLHYPFENGSNSSNESYTRDYSSYGNNGTVIDVNNSATSGYDGYGSYLFTGLYGYIYRGLPTMNVMDGLTIEFRARPNEWMDKLSPEFRSPNTEMCAVDLGTIRACFTKDGYFKVETTANESSPWNITPDAAKPSTARWVSFTEWNGTLWGATSSVGNASVFKYNRSGNLANCCGGNSVSDFTFAGVTNLSHQWYAGFEGNDPGGLIVWNGSLYAIHTRNTNPNVSLYRYVRDKQWEWIGQVHNNSDGGGGNSIVTKPVIWNNTICVGTGTGNVSVLCYQGGGAGQWRNHGEICGTGACSTAGLNPLFVYNGTMWAGTNLNGSLYRYDGQARDGNGQNGIWTHVHRAPTGYKFEEAVILNNTLYLAAGGSAKATSVYRWNGTSTNPDNAPIPYVADTGTTTSGIPRSMVVYNNSIYMVTDSSGIIWRINGTNFTNTSVAGSESAWDMLYVWNGSIWASSASSGNIYRSGGGIDVLSTGKINTTATNGYKHYVVTKNLTDVAIYIDGVLNNSMAMGVYSGANSYAPIDYLRTISNEVMIGTSSTRGAGQYGLNFNGSLDEVRIYNRSLSRGQIWNLWVNQTWQMDENMTSIHQNWTACVTGNDRTASGPTSCSNQFNTTIEIFDGPPPAGNAPPNVTALIPTAGSSFEGNSVIEIGATAIDGSMVSNVSANITFPNSSTHGISLSNGSAHATKYNTSFTVPLLSGSYTVRIIANDTSNLFNSTQTTSFSVTLAYTANLTVKGYGREWILIQW